jgi:hypothetical protein
MCKTIANSDGGKSIALKKMNFFAWKSKEEHYQFIKEEGWYDFNFRAVRL